MSHSVRTELFEIGPGSRPYLIAEIGLNHNGDLDLAKRMVDAAKAAGASSAKFQLFSSEFFIHPGSSLGDGGPGSLAGFFKRFELKADDWMKLADHTRAQGLDFACSVFDAPSVELYKALRPAYVKIASCDVNNFLLLDMVRPMRLPVFLSTGTADENEVEAAVRHLSGLPVVLFQCVSSYPAQPSQYNLRVLPNWQKKYGVPTALSDHTEGLEISLASIALGACALERHFTLSRKLAGPDQQLSLEPADFAQLHQQSLRVWQALGDGVKACTEPEKPVRSGGRRTLFAFKEIAQGETIHPDDIIAMRPGTGISVARYAEFVGKRASKAMHPFEELR